MNTQELYAYIDERIERLSMDEKTHLYAGKDMEAFGCIAKKIELLDLKLFIQMDNMKIEL